MYQDHLKSYKCFVSVRTFCFYACESLRVHHVLEWVILEPKLIILTTNIQWGSLRGGVVNLLDCDIVVDEFEL